MLIIHCHKSFDIPYLTMALVDERGNPYLKTLSPQNLNLIDIATAPAENLKLD